MLNCCWDWQEQCLQWMQLLAGHCCPQVMSGLQQLCCQLLVPAAVQSLTLLLLHLGPLPLLLLQLQMCL